MRCLFQSFNGNFSRVCIPRIPARALLRAPGSTAVAARLERTAPTPHDRPARPGSSLRPVPRSGSGTSRSGCSSWPSRSCNDDAEFLRSSSREVRGGRLRVPGRFRYSMDVPLLAMVPRSGAPLDRRGWRVVGPQNLVIVETHVLDDIEFDYLEI